LLEIRFFPLTNLISKLDFLSSELTPAFAEGFRLRAKRYGGHVGAASPRFFPGAKIARLGASKRARTHPLRKRASA